MSRLLVRVLLFFLAVALIFTVCSVTIGEEAADAATPHRLHGWERVSRDAERTEVYRVRKGDTLEQIAAEHDVPGGFERLHYVNRKKIDSADIIDVGTLLVIPAHKGKVIEYTPPEPVWTPSSSSSSSSVSSAPSVSSSTTTGGSWDSVAQCESSGDWSANTGNGYYGGLQFTLSSWRAAGGSGYPHEASKDEQTMRAEILDDMQADPWPNC